MSEELEQRLVPYTTNVEMCWKATCVSPISGQPLEAYADSVTEARQRIDLQILRECEERGITIQARLTPAEMSALKPTPAATDDQER